MYAYKDLKHLKSLYIPGIKELGLGFHGAGCGFAYFNVPGLRQKVEKHREETEERVASKVDTLFMMGNESSLCELILGPRHWGPQILWEKGEDGKLYRSKAIHRSRRTSKVVTISKPLKVLW